MALRLPVDPEKMDETRAIFRKVTALLRGSTFKIQSQIKKVIGRKYGIYIHDENCEEVLEFCAKLNKHLDDNPSDRQAEMIVEVLKAVKNGASWYYKASKIGDSRFHEQFITCLNTLKKKKMESEAVLECLTTIDVPYAQNKWLFQRLIDLDPYYKGTDRIEQRQIINRACRDYDQPPFFLSDNVWKIYKGQRNPITEIRRFTRPTDSFDFQVPNSETHDLRNFDYLILKRRGILSIQNTDGETKRPPRLYNIIVEALIKDRVIADGIEPEYLAKQLGVSLASLRTTLSREGNRFAPGLIPGIKKHCDYKINPELRIYYIEA